ncbi:MAG: Zn-ribbon domain-containing OB-fold protein [Acidibrevibacterium sp.]|uniref:Zn-ribbon domain-containing OB-fold protein n=1 Tax=Acidibrevibacterium fodinaquatile TaxID=1969806 RepID=UPI000E0D81A5|nr:Zn-ribbon domain-containing OB-fold protein [Acidibrevibacterium fodinaquatile]MCA7119639.1 Zn-ribbon domain-containing OB-fold protein [Acidibrevibacterium fodinaquatile]
MSTRRKIPAPEANPETAAYWQAAASGKLVIRECSHCGKLHHYPRALCPFCFKPATGWREVSGRGKIYAYSVMRRAETPYAIAYVTLEEGVTMLTNLIDCDFDGLRIGQAVTLVFQDSEGGPPVPMFSPA